MVWGRGVLTWNVGGETVSHPLLTHRVQIGFNTDTGEMALMPAGSALARSLEAASVVPDLLLGDDLEAALDSLLDRYDRHAVLLFV